MSFLIKSNIKKFGKKFNNSIKKWLDREHVCNKKYLTKGKINTNFCNKIPKESSQWITLTNSLFRIGKNYYPKVYLQECKYFIKEEKIFNYTANDINNFLTILIEKILIILRKKIPMNNYTKNQLFCTWFWKIVCNWNFSKKLCLEKIYVDKISGHLELW